VVAGAREVGEAFLHEVRPFVYPRTHFASPLEQIADIKRKIEATVDVEANVKLGQGGIRDVEFIVQALQLLYGGTKENLRASNTLDALDRLAVENILSDGERNRLRQAYLFFRTVEHRLQLLHGMQTHSLPSSIEEMEILRKRLGFRSLNAFRNRLARHRQHVKRIFDATFSAPKHGRPPTIVTPAALKKAGVQNRKLALRILSALSEDDRAGASLPTFLASLKHHRNAEAALMNIGRWLESPLTRRPALVGLREMTDVFVLLASRSSILSDALAREPLLFESLLSRPDEILQGGFSWDLLSDPRRFRAFNEFATVLRFLLGRGTIEQTLGQFSQIAREFVVRQFETACAQHAVDPERCNVAVVALGKCGGGEMSLRSDIDLVLLYDGGAKVKEACERLAKRLIESSLADGVPAYELDFRLRPEGKNAPLAVEVIYYRRYLHERASLWERQSLTKAIVVAGDERLAERFVRIRDEFVHETPLPESWTQEVRSMRSKIERERAAGSGVDLKTGRGGLIDLEFLLQALQLRFGGEHSSLRAENAFRVLDAVEALRLLPKSDVRVLRTNLIFMRTLELAIHLNIENAAFTLPTSSDQLRTLASFMGTTSVVRLKQRLRVILRRNRQLFRTTLQRCAT
jgi:glutamate-ammonia-ligase adenylyltransferase